MFHFVNGQEDPHEGEFYIGSADWMDRNLSRRVEAVAPLSVRHLRERLWEHRLAQLEDYRNAWQMRPDGSYEQPRAGNPASKVAREGTRATHMKRTRARLRL